MYSKIVYESNLYSTPKYGICANFTIEDILEFLSIELIMGVVEMPAYTDYWSRTYRYDKVANIMPLKKYQKLRRFLQINNNLEVDDDRYFKIMPLVDMIRNIFP